MSINGSKVKYMSSVCSVAVVYMSSKGPKVEYMSIVCSAAVVYMSSSSSKEMYMLMDLATRIYMGRGEVCLEDKSTRTMAHKDKFTSTRSEM